MTSYPALLEGFSPKTHQAERIQLLATLLDPSCILPSDPETVTPFSTEDCHGLV